MSYHLIVHLKAKGTATLWPDKVAVLQAWSRKGRSLGFSPLDRAIGRPRCSFDRAFTVISPGLLRPAGWGGYVGRAQRGCPVTQDDQSAPPAIWRMRWRFTGANTKRSGGSPQLSPTKFVRADPRSRYGRKSGFLPQGDWPVNPDALPVRPVT